MSSTIETNKQEKSPAEDAARTAAERTTEPPGVDENGEVIEHGGPSGPEPTRFGDWERKGRCIDF